MIYYSVLQYIPRIIHTVFDVGVCVCTCVIWQFCHYYAGIPHWYWINEVKPQLPDEHGPLARYIRLRVTHVSEMPGTFSPPPRVSDPNMHRGTCVTLVPWCMLGSLTSGFIWSWWRGKRSRCMRKPWFYVSGKRPIAEENGSMNHKNLLGSEDIMTIFNKI